MNETLEILLNISADASEALNVLREIQDALGTVGNSIQGFVANASAATAGLSSMSESGRTTASAMNDVFTTTQQTSSGLSGFIQNAGQVAFEFNQIFDAASTAVNGVIGFANSLVQSNATLEGFATQYKAFLGSVENGYARIGAIQQIKSPFDLNALVETDLILQRTGHSSDALYQSVVNAAAGIGGTNDKLEALGGVVQRLVDGQFGRAFLQLERMGVATRGMFEQEGLKFNPSGSYQGSVDEVMTALQNIIHNRFGTAASDMADTFNGLTAQIRNATMELQAVFGASLFDGVKEGMQGFLTLLRSPEITNFATVAGTAFGAVAQSIIGVANQAMSAFVGAIGMINDAVAGIAAPVGNVVGLILQAFAPLGGAISAALQGDLQGAIGLVGQFVQNIGITMVSGLASLADSLFTGGENDIIAFVNGLISGAGQFLFDALNSIANVVASFLEGHSPPKQGPLSTIDTWFPRVIEAYLGSWNTADFGALTSLTTHVSKYFEELVKTGQMSVNDALTAVIGTNGSTGLNQLITQAIDNIKKTGKDTGAAIDQIKTILGETGKEVFGQIKAGLDSLALNQQITALQADMAKLNNPAAAKAIADALKKAQDDLKNARTSTEQRAAQGQIDLLKDQQNGANSQKTALQEQINLLQAQQKLIQDQASGYQAIESLQQGEVAFQQQLLDMQIATAAEKVKATGNPADEQAHIDALKQKLGGLTVGSQEYYKVLADIKAAEAERVKLIDQIAKGPPQTQAQKDAKAAADAQFNYNYQLADTPTKLVMLQDKLSGVKQGSAEYYKILLDIAKLQDSTAKTEEQRLKDAKTAQDAYNFAMADTAGKITIVNQRIKDAAPGSAEEFKAKLELFNLQKTKKTEDDREIQAARAFALAQTDSAGKIKIVQDALKDQSLTVDERRKLEEQLMVLQKTTGADKEAQAKKEKDDQFAIKLAHADAAQALVLQREKLAGLQQGTVEYADQQVVVAHAEETAKKAAEAQAKKSASAADSLAKATLGADLAGKSHSEQIAILQGRLATLDPKSKEYQQTLAKLETAQAAAAKAGVAGGKAADTLANAQFQATLKGKSHADQVALLSAHLATLNPNSLAAAHIQGQLNTQIADAAKVHNTASGAAHSLAQAQFNATLAGKSHAEQVALLEAHLATLDPKSKDFAVTQTRLANAQKAAGKEAEAHARAGDKLSDSALKAAEAGKTHAEKAQLLGERLSHLTKDTVEYNKINAQYKTEMALAEKEASKHHSTLGDLVNRTKELKEYGLSPLQIAVQLGREAFGQFNDSMGVGSTKFDELRDKFNSTPLGKTINDGLQEAIGGIRDFQSFIRGLFNVGTPDGLDATGNAIKGFSKVAHDAGALLRADLIDKIQAVKDWFDKNGPAIMDGINTGINAFIRFIGSVGGGIFLVLKGAFDTLKSYFDANGDSIMSKIHRAISDFKTFIDENGGLLFNALTAAYDAAYKIFTTTSDPMATIHGFIETFKQYIITNNPAGANGIFAPLKDAMDIFGKATGQVGDGLFSPITAGFNKARDYLETNHPQLFAAIMKEVVAYDTTVKPRLTILFDAAKDAFNIAKSLFDRNGPGLFAAIQKAVNDFSVQLAGTPAGMFKPLKDAVGDLKTFTNGIAPLLFGGIQDAYAAFKKTFEATGNPFKAIQDAVSTLKSDLGGQSPFATLTKDLEPLGGEMGKLASAFDTIKGSIGALKGTIDAFKQGNASGGLLGGLDAGIAAFITNAGKVNPALDGVIKKAQEVKAWIDTNVPIIQADLAKIGVGLGDVGKAADTHKKAILEFGAAFLVFRQIAPIISPIATVIGGIGTILGGIKGAAVFLVDAVKSIQGFGLAVIALRGPFTAFFDAVKLGFPVFTAFSAAFSPLTAVIVAVALIVGVLGLAWATNFGHIREHTAHVIELFQQFGSVIGTVLGPVFKEIGNIITNGVVPAFNHLIEGIGQGLAPIMKALGGTFEALAPVFHVVELAFGAIVVVIAAVATLIGGTLLVVLQAFLGMLGGTLQVAFAVAGVAISTFIIVVNTIITIFVTVAKVIVDFGIFLYKVFTGDMPGATAAASKILADLRDGFIQIFKNIGDILSNFVAGIGHIFSGLLTGGLAPFEALYLAISGKTSGLTDQIIKYFGDMITRVTGDIKNWIDGIIGFFNHLYDVLVGHSIVPDMVTGIIGSFGKMYTDTVKFVTTLKDEAIAKFSALKDEAVAHAKALYDQWLGGDGHITKLKNEAVDLILHLKDEAIAHFELFVQGAQEKGAALYTAWLGSDGHITKFRKEAVDLVLHLKDEAIAHFNLLLTGAKEKGQAIYDEWLGSSGHITKLKDDVVTKVLNLKDEAVAKFELLKTEAVQKAQDLYDGFIGANGKFVQLQDNVVNYILHTLAPNVVNEFKTLVTNAGTAVGKLVTDFVGPGGRFPNLLSSVISFVSNPVSGFITIGTGIVNGVKAGIEAAWQSLVDKVTALFNNLPGPIKKLLGMQSPSTVFRDQIGKPIVQGVQVGIESESSNLAASAVRTINTMVHAATQASGAARIPSPTFGSLLSASGSSAAPASAGGELARILDQFGDAVNIFRDASLRIVESLGRIGLSSGGIGSAISDVRGTISDQADVISHQSNAINDHVISTLRGILAEINHTPLAGAVGSVLQDIPAGAPVELNYTHSQNISLSGLTPEQVVNIFNELQATERQQLIAALVDAQSR